MPLLQRGQRLRHRPLEVTRVEESPRLPSKANIDKDSAGRGEPELPLPARPGALMDGNQGGGEGGRGSERFITSPGSLSCAARWLHSSDQRFPSAG